MAVNSTQVAFECAAEFAVRPDLTVPVAEVFQTWIDDAVTALHVAEDAYAALRAAVEQCDAYMSLAAVLAVADEFLALIEAAQV